jgi:hypothetical protein
MALGNHASGVLILGRVHPWMIPGARIVSKREAGTHAGVPLQEIKRHY